MLVIPPDGPLQATEFTAPLDLPVLQKAVGGYLETVPLFHSIMHGGKLHRCVAFCDEDGKRKELPLNDLACAAWDAALRRDAGGQNSRADKLGTQIEAAVLARLSRRPGRGGVRRRRMDGRAMTWNKEER